MNIDEIDAELTSDRVLDDTRAFNGRLRVLARDIAPAYVSGPAAARLARLTGEGMASAPEYLSEGRDEAVAGRSGRVGIRVFTPSLVQGVYLHIHGGGWVLGAADQQDPALWRLAQAASVAVVSVDYRRAPEDPYPAGPDDCEDVARWLVREAAGRFGTDRLVIGGGSAGAHLAAITLLRLRDKGGDAGAFCAANFDFGVYDLSMTPSQRLWGDDYLVLSPPLMRWFYDCFVPGLDAEGRRSPEISPMYADLGGMPPARFLVGSLDMLLDDTLFMESRWRQAGSRTRLIIVPEAVHGFTAYSNMAAELAGFSTAEFIKAAISK